MADSTEEGFVLPTENRSYFLYNTCLSEKSGDENFLWRSSPTLAQAAALLRSLDHAQLDTHTHT